MTLKIDDDVERAAAFMQANFAATKLVPIVEALSALAPILWGRYGREGIEDLSLCSSSPAESQPEAATR